jgi:uncharacterized delta-60 repeat protein
MVEARYVTLLTMVARPVRASVILAVFSLVVASSAQGAPGDLDLTFGGGDGHVITDIQRDNRVTISEEVTDVARQADGRIVVVGGAILDDGRTVAVVVRYGRNGALDRTFGGGDGIVRTPVGRASSIATAVAVQGNGKIVVVGGAGGRFLVARYHPSGALDKTFGGDGIALTDFSAEGDQAFGIVIQRDGKIVAGGRGGAFGGRFVLARYRRDGSLDTSYSGDGKATVNFSAEDDPAFALAQQADGKIVAAGQAFEYPDGRFALARFRTNGALDLTFGTGGKVTLDVTAGDDDVANGVAIQPDGKIVAVGSASFINSGWALARYNPDGTPDLTFDGDGLVLTNLGPDFDDGYDVAVQADGKLIAVGDGGRGNFGLARYHPDGSLDTSFGGDGRVGASLAQGSDFAIAVTLQPNGRIVAAGPVRDYGRFGVARFLAE